MTPERFMRRVMPEPNSGCWLWTGVMHSAGYGQVGFHRGGKRWHVRAHRLSYALFVGPIPDGLYVCHKCDVRLCVNPDHLFLGTQRDNILDAVRKGRVKAPVVPYAEKRRRTLLSECRRGHPFTPDNTYWKGTMRSCRACQRDRARSAYHERNPQAVYYRKAA